jgi:GT2 family glycosyltransferase
MNVKGASLPRSVGLSASIVVYNPDEALLRQTLASFGAACERLRADVPECTVVLFLIDNGGLGDVRDAIDRLGQQHVSCRTLTGHGNVGYGRGHNLAIEQAQSDFHLVLNPDIDLEANALVAACTFFSAHDEAGLLAPWIGDESGSQQYLCRRYPAVLDLLARGLLPSALRDSPLFATRLARYEMKDVINGTSVLWDPPIISGCFMLFRTNVLKRLGGFDPRYFLYFEDYDLSLRSHKVTRVAYVPASRVVHHGGGAARKGFIHIRMFSVSAFRFFNRFGWRWW